MRPIMIFIIAGMFFLSCSHRNEQSSFIDLRQQDSVSIFDIFESVDVVFLETNEQSLIGNISKVGCFKNRYYILDGKQQIVFCFDSIGNFLFRISQRGHGPNEYIYLGDLSIDPYNNQLLLLEPYGNLLVFDLDGQFLSKIRLPSEVVAYNRVYPIDENNLLFSSFTYDELVFYNRQEHTIFDRRFGIDADRLGFGLFSPHNIYHYQGDLFFSPPPFNEIINLSDSSVFSWNFGKRTNTKEKVKQLKKFILTSNIDFNPKPPYYEGYDWIGQNKLGNVPFQNFESSRYRFYYLQTKHNFTKYIFYDKKTKKPVIFGKTKEGITFWFPQFNGESIVLRERGWVKKIGNPDIDKDLVYYHPDIFTKEQRQQYESRKEDDNPFLVIYNFKQ